MYTHLCVENGFSFVVNAAQHNIDCIHILSVNGFSFRFNCDDENSHQNLEIFRWHTSPFIPFTFMKCVGSAFGRHQCNAKSDDWSTLNCQGFSSMCHRHFILYHFIFIDLDKWWPVRNDCFILFFTLPLWRAHTHFPGIEWAERWKRKPTKAVCLFPSNSIHQLDGIIPFLLTASTIIFQHVLDLMPRNSSCSLLALFFHFLFCRLLVLFLTVLFFSFYAHVLCNLRYMTATAAAAACHKFIVTRTWCMWKFSGNDVCEENSRVPFRSQTHTTSVFWMSHGIFLCIFFLWLPFNSLNVQFDSAQIEKSMSSHHK